MLRADWEKRFDERFGPFTAFLNIGDPVNEKSISPEDIKKFIRELLCSEERSIFDDNPRLPGETFQDYKWRLAKEIFKTGAN